MSQTLFQSVKDQASDQEQAVIVQAVGSVVLDSLLGLPGGGFNSTYKAAGGVIPETSQVLSGLDQAWKTLDLSSVKPVFSSVHMENVSSEERALIERSIGTALWRSLAAGSPVNPTEVYRSLGGSRANTIKVFDASAPHFAQIDFKSA
jgi:hypothetical protein